MTIKNHRTKLDYSAERLRRAKRLYFKLISKRIPVGKVGVQAVQEMAVRLQERGIYSEKSSKADVKFWIYRALYKYSKRPYEGWFDWLMANGYSNKPWHSQKVG